MSTNASVQRWAGWVIGRSLVLRGTTLESSDAHFVVSLGRNICMWEEVAPSGEMAWTWGLLGLSEICCLEEHTLLTATELLLFLVSQRTEYPDSCTICVQGSLGMSWWLAIICCCQREYHRVCEAHSRYKMSVWQRNIRAYWHTTFHNNSFVYQLLFGYTFLIYLRWERDRSQ